MFSIMGGFLILIAVLVSLFVPFAALHWLFSGASRLNELYDRFRDFKPDRQRDVIARLEARIEALEARVRPDGESAPAPESLAEAIGRGESVEGVTSAETPSPVEAAAKAAPTPEPAAERPEPIPPASPEPRSAKADPSPASAPPVPELLSKPSALARLKREFSRAAGGKGTEATGSAPGRLRAAEWESRIGRSWLNVIGVVVLVVGVVLLIGYSLRYLGPPGRVAIGFATGTALLLGGWWLEKLERYRAFSLAPIGGGWALAYFTAYAAHNVEAARIIANPLWALPLMVAVAAGMIWHSFRYASQIVTGLAYGLAYFAVVLSPLTGFSLFASSLLGVSLVAVLRVVPWYHLGTAGIAGTYVCFFLWMESSAAGQAGLAAPGAFTTSIAVLAFYWAMFSVAAFVRKPSTRTEEFAVLVLSAANTVGFFSLAVWVVRTTHPGELYVLTLLGGSAYVVLSYLLRVARLHLTFLLNALTAAVLFAVTVPLALPQLELSRDWLALPWAIEAAIVLVLGFRLKEIALRLAGYLLCGFVLVAVFGVNLQGDPEGRQLVLWLTVPTVIAFFFTVFEKLQRSAGKQDVRPQAAPLALVFGYGATALLATFLWLEVSKAYVAIAWLISGMVFVEIGLRASRAHVRFQGYLLCGLALGASIFINLLDPGLERSDPDLRTWAIVGVCVSLFYLLYARLKRPLKSKLFWPNEGSVVEGASYAGAVLLAALLAKKLDADLVGLAWILAGVVSFEAGMRWSRLHLRYQAYGFAAISVAALLLVNLYGLIALPGDAVPLRLPVVGTAVALLYYLFARLAVLSRRDQALTTHERTWAALPSYAATALLVVLAWVELNSVAVVVAWILLALILYEVGGWLRQPALKLQAHVLAVMSFGRLFFANFTAFGDVSGLSHRVLSVTPVVAIFYYLRNALGQDSASAAASPLCRYMPQLYSYGAAIALVVLARFEFGRGGAMLAWAPLALVFLLLGTQFKDRDFRIQSYVIALLTFVRSWATNLSLVGSFYGIPERIATTSVAIAAFLAATFFCLWKREVFAGFAGKANLFQRIDGNARVLFSFLATALLAVLLAYEVDKDWLTMAWALEAFVVLALGFVTLERSFRIYGLALLLICLLKLVVMDMQGAETLYRIFSFIVVGVILLLISFGYTRYQETIRRYL